jgi:hypothetical protein
MAVRGGGQGEPCKYRLRAMDMKGTRVGIPVGGTICLVVTVASLALWVGSMFHQGIGIIGLSQTTNLQIYRGIIEVRHIYALGIAPAMTEADWRAACVAHSWYVPKWDGSFPGLAFHDGLVSGEISPHGGLISPNKYWMLRLPLWPVTVICAVLAVWLLRRWYRRRQVERRGFEALVKA